MTEGLIAAVASVSVVLFSTLLARSGAKHEREVTLLELDILSRLDPDKEASQGLSEKIEKRIHRWADRRTVASRIADIAYWASMLLFGAILAGVIIWITRDPGFKPFSLEVKVLALIASISVLAVPTFLVAVLFDNWRRILTFLLKTARGVARTAGRTRAAGRRMRRSLIK